MGVSIQLYGENAERYSIWLKYFRLRDGLPVDHPLTAIERTAAFFNARRGLYPWS